MGRPSRRSCAYCGCSQDLTQDHVIPKALWPILALPKRAVNNPSNRVYACLKCNQEKGCMLPGEFLKRHPEYRSNFVNASRFLSDDVKDIVWNGPPPRQKQACDAITEASEMYALAMSETPTA